MKFLHKNRQFSVEFSERTTRCYISMQRILLIQPFASRIGGVDSVILQLIRGLKCTDIEFVVLIPLGSPYVNCYKDLEAKVVSFNFSVFSKTASLIDLLKPFIQFLPSVIRVIRLLQSEQINLVHSHKINVLVGDIAAKLSGVPAIHTIHEVATGPLWPYRIFSWIIRFTCQAIIILCDASGNLIAEDWRNLARVHKIYNGVDTTIFAPGLSHGQALKEELGINRDAIVVTAMSRIQDTKGLEYYIDAAANVLRTCQNVVFLMVGDTISDKPEFIAYKESLQRKVQLHNMGERFIFTGIRSDVIEVLAATDIFVLSSVFDILPTAVIEAMSMGKPVVATSVGGVPEILKDGITGIIVPPRSSLDLAKGIKCLIADTSLRRSMGKAGRRRAVTHFDARHYVSQTEQLYREVLLAHSKS